MPKAKTTKILLDEAKSLFLERAAELWKTHSASILKIIEDSEGRKMNVAFSCMMDFSESVAGVDTRISFSETVTDKRHDDIDDGSQLNIPGTSREELKGSKKKKGSEEEEDEIPGDK